MVRRDILPLISFQQAPQSLDVNRWFWD